MALPVPDLSHLTLADRLGFHRVAAELSAHPEPAPIERRLAEARGPREPWEHVTGAHGLPSIVVLPRVEPDGQLRGLWCVLLAVRHDGFVRTEIAWERLGSHRDLREPGQVAALLAEMQARCAILVEAVLQDPAGDLDRLPHEVREALRAIRLSTDHPEPSEVAWAAAPVLRGWRLEHDRWGVPVLTGLLDRPVGAPQDATEPLSLILVQVWDAGRREMETTRGLLRLGDHATSPSDVTSYLRDVGDECARLRTELILRAQR